MRHSPYLYIAVTVYTVAGLQNFKTAAYRQVWFEIVL